MRRRYTLFLLACAALLSPHVAAAQEAPLTVFAAASLTDVMKTIAATWTADGHPAPRFSFASSSTLARQIDNGAPADVFASADEQWADWLQQRDQLVAGTRKSLLTNSLVIVVAKDRARSITVGRDLDLATLLGPTGRLATGDPAHVPVGIYAEAALKSLGLWDRVEPRLARAEDVRGALVLVERGEAPAGIVYATDAAVSAGVVVAGTFPDDSHPSITYPFALVRGHDTPAARAFLGYLSGPAARAAFTQAGFGVSIAGP